MTVQKTGPLFGLLFLCLCSCVSPDSLEPGGPLCEEVISDNNSDYPQHVELQQLLREIVQDGVPGIQLSLRHHGQHWNGAAGMANLSNGQELLACDITRVGSTVKTFTAATVLQLVEAGKIALDNPISDYLSTEQLAGLENAEEATVRQLLQHSSGIYNYIVNLEFQTASLNELRRVWYPEDLLSYARGKAANFPVGENVDYSNTNYILLGQLIEAVTGKPFYEVFQEQLFQPLGLEYTQFAATDPVPDAIIHGYIDLYSNFNLTDATDYSGWDYFTADGGLISNSHDLAAFMEALFNDRVLQSDALADMRDWQRPAESDFGEYEVEYGLGIFRMNTPYGEAYMHSGDAIGYYATMFYFPDHELAVAWAVNGNYGKIDQFTQEQKAMERIFKVIFE